MKVFIIHIFEEFYDSNYTNLIEIKDKFKATFHADIDFNEIESKFYELLGEGIAISSNYSNSTAYFKINLLSNNNIDLLLVFLAQFKQIDDEPDFIVDFANFNYSDFIQITSGDIYLNKETKNDIENYLINAGIDFKTIRGNEIYEKGASSYWETFLIALSSRLSVETIKGIFSSLKDKLSSSNKDLEIIKIQDSIKSFLLREYNLKPTDIYLSRFYKNHNKTTTIIYKSKKSQFIIEINNSGNITNIKVKPNTIKK